MSMNTNTNANAKAMKSYMCFMEGDVAARKGRQCQIKKIHFEMHPPAVTVFMYDTEAEVGTEFDRLQRIESWFCSMCTAQNKSAAHKCAFCAFQRNYKEKVIVVDIEEQKESIKEQSEKPTFNNISDNDEHVSNSEQLSSSEHMVASDQNNNNNYNNNNESEEEEEEEPMISTPPPPPNRRRPIGRKTHRPSSYYNSNDNRNNDNDNDNDSDSDDTYCSRNMYGGGRPQYFHSAQRRPRMTPFNDPWFGNGRWSWF